MALSWLINVGDPNYLLTGMILQVGNLQGNSTKNISKTGWPWVGNEGPSTFTGWYIGDETSRNFPT